MLPVFADPKTDVVFKRIFGAEDHKPLLIALLNDLLALSGTQRIRSVEHLSLEQRVTAPKSKLSLVDVKCTTRSGRRFVVEMQVLPVEGFEKRVVYNASKAYVIQAGEGDLYHKLCDVVGVTICNFKLWPKKIKDRGYKVPMLSRWRMQEQQSGHKGLRQIQYAFLELPKYSAGKAPETVIDRWAYFFREAKNLEVVPPALAEGPFLEALEIARKSTFTEAEWLEYERSKMAEQDERGRITFAHRQGEHKGKIEGKIEGRAEGAAHALLTVLRVRGIAVPDAARERILAEKDPARLERWHERAILAASVAEVIDEPSSQP
jgi:predicted transposase/invertase (TIGR01784 family)